MTETGAASGRAKFEGPGGTPGGLGEVLVGLLMIAIGIYIVFDHVTVHTSFWRFFGSPGTSFGLTLMPLLGGIGVLFFNGRSVLGWLLTVGGVALILVGVLMNLDIYFRPTSLWGTIVMFGLIAGGLGVFARGLRPHARKRRPAARRSAHRLLHSAPPRRERPCCVVSVSRSGWRPVCLVVQPSRSRSRRGRGRPCRWRWISRRSPPEAGPTTR